VSIRKASIGKLKKKNLNRFKTEITDKGKKIKYGAAQNARKVFSFDHMQSKFAKNYKMNQISNIRTLWILRNADYNVR
jgi:hypothetical protein